MYELYIYIMELFYSKNLNFNNVKNNTYMFILS